jgi:hypothetical protein
VKWAINYCRRRVGEMLVMKALNIYAGGLTSEGRILTRKSLLSVTVIGSMMWTRG